MCSFTSWTCAHQYFFILTRAKAIWQKVTSLFYHIRQVAARVAKLVLCGAFGITILRKDRRGLAMVLFDAMVVSYRLCVVTIALFLTIQPQFVIECLRRSNQQSGSLWDKIWGGRASFNAICERRVAVSYAKNRVDIFCRLSTMNECDKQTTEW